ncbi:hypothetical protein M1B35_05415 [Pseudomonas sp. MAFF 302046]|jgi:hypothetical protein|uniref:DUF2244 domain-containing protein n=1 Tax=Pseudomonas morbosilactucae TaxID=2938197 RepID=A0ABT0JCK9_9PSED|nr:hypothetical protein [Pseudomonas morbosilactucae]MCK9813597.1 hypothetical protein [Pseudomonas morbosilactucae]
MGRTLSRVEIQDIQRRERQNLRATQAFFFALFSALAFMPLMGVWLMVSPALACALVVPWLIVLWWWVYYRARVLVDEVGEQTQWLQARFSVRLVTARNSYLDYRFGDYPVAPSNLLNNWFIDKTLNTHSTYRVEAVKLTCRYTSSHSYYLFRDTLMEVPQDQAPATGVAGTTTTP